MEMLSLPMADRECKISFLHQMSVSETYHIHTHDFYEIFYVVKGRAVHNINGFSECCVSGTAELIRPRDCHEYSFINHYDMELFSIGIAEEIMSEIIDFTELSADKINNGEFPPQITYPPSMAEKLTAELSKIGTITDPQKKRSYAKSVISRLILEMTETNPSPVKIPYWLENLITEMNKRDNFVVGLERMLELACVSQNHLNREMKKHFGLTPTEFINSKRVLYASELLAENKQSVMEICGICGFETPSNFYSNFRKVFDCTPNEFKKRITHQYTEKI